MIDKLDEQVEEFVKLLDETVTDEKVKVMPISFYERIELLKQKSLSS